MMRNENGRFEVLRAMGGLGEAARYVPRHGASTAAGRKAPESGFTRTARRFLQAYDTPLGVG